MAKFVVKGIPAFNGEYPIDVGTFTMRELQIIKRMSGVRAGELEEAFGAGDSDLILAVAVVAVRQSKKDWQAFEALAWESDVGAISFVGDEEEDEGTAGDAVPLVPPTPPADSESSVEQPPSSGPPSSDDGDDSQETNLPATGQLRSVTGAA